jgi:peroxiredoxin
MVLTPSSMLPLGTKAPDFSLPDTVSGQTYNLQQLKSDIATVVMFICNHCPYVQYIIEEVANVANEYKNKNIHFIAISANDIQDHPDDSPDNMQKFAKQHHFTFPYLYDESQKIAKAYHAECTPDFYVFDKNLHCVYRGRFDASSPGKNVPVDGKDLREVLNNVLTNKPISDEQYPSMGCNIKWKSR